VFYIWNTVQQCRVVHALIRSPASRVVFVSPREAELAFFLTSFSKNLGVVLANRVVFDIVLEKLD
jgi:hypothetical protein